MSADNSFEELFVKGNRELRYDVKGDVELERFLNLFFKVRKVTAHLYAVATKLKRMGGA